MRLESAVRDIVRRPGSSVPGPPCVMNGLVPDWNGSAGFTETTSNCDFAASGEMDKHADTVCATTGVATNRKMASAFKIPLPPGISVLDPPEITLQYETRAISRRWA